MTSGKKTIAERIVYTAIDKNPRRNRYGRSSRDPQQGHRQHQAAPGGKSRRVGGATYQVPMEVPAERQVALAMRWLVNFANARKGVPMENALAYELKDAAAGQGNAIKKRDDMHKMAQANRARPLPLVVSICFRKKAAPYRYAFFLPDQ